MNRPTDFSTVQKERMKNAASQQVMAFFEASAKDMPTDSPDGMAQDPSKLGSYTSAVQVCEKLEHIIAASSSRNERMSDELSNQIGDFEYFRQKLALLQKRTSQLKELRNTIRRQTTSLDQIFPTFFKV